MFKHTFPGKSFILMRRKTKQISYIESIPLHNLRLSFFPSSYSPGWKNLLVSLWFNELQVTWIWMKKSNKKLWNFISYFYVFLLVLVECFVNREKIKSEVLWFILFHRRAHNANPFLVSITNGSSLCIHLFSLHPSLAAQQTDYFSSI